MTTSPRRASPHPLHFPMVVIALAALVAIHAPGARAGAQSWLRDHGYRPAVIGVSSLEQIGAQLFAANIAFDDHPQDRLSAGAIDVVTADSALDYLVEIDPAATVRVLSVVR